jgi:dopamine beta-monooxygenase
MKLPILLLLSLLYAYPRLTLAKDPSAYFGGSGNEGYLAWLTTVKYDKSVFVGSNKDDAKGVALHWTIDGESIKLAVAAQASGWVAFGLGESGSMLGADIVMYSAASNELVDSYVLDQTIMPYRDECQSWTLIDSTVTDGFIIFEASRPLDTGDSQDRVIADDPNEMRPPTRVLAAWGDSVAPSYHGDSTARGAIRFLGNSTVSDELESFQISMKAEAQGSFAIRANNFTIPTDRTTYQNFCLSRDDLLAINVDLDKDLHVIGFESFIDPRTKSHVHHFVLTASSDPWNSSLPCNDYPGFETVYGWAPGDVPLNLPSFIGSPLGSNGYQSFQLEIHYDNPEGTPNMIDDSGARLFFTSNKRQYDLGSFTTGDPQVAMDGSVLSPSGGLSQHVFDCPSSCSSNYVAEPITVIRQQLHMHAVGVSMVNAQIRNGQVVRQGQVEYWDFRQQGDYVVPQGQFTVQPGDSFRTICNYNSINNETWGLGSNNEMCMATFYYYPRQETFAVCGVGVEEFLPGCEASYETTPNFCEARQLGRAFGTPSTTCSKVTEPKSSAVSNQLVFVSSFLILVVSGSVMMW